MLILLHNFVRSHLFANGYRKYLYRVWVKPSQQLGLRLHIRLWQFPSIPLNSSSLKTVRVFLLNFCFQYILMVPSKLLYILQFNFYLCVIKHKLILIILQNKIYVQFRKLSHTKAYVPTVCQSITIFLDIYI
jgi:hypothetical protein